MSENCFGRGSLPVSIGCGSTFSRPIEMPNFDEPPFRMDFPSADADVAINHLGEIKYGKTYEALIRLNQLQGNFRKDTTPENMAFELHFSYDMSKKRSS